MVNRNSFAILSRHQPVGHVCNADMFDKLLVRDDRDLDAGPGIDDHQNLQYNRLVFADFFKHIRTFSFIKKL